MKGEERKKKREPHPTPGVNPHAHPVMAFVPQLLYKLRKFSLQFSRIRNLLPLLPRFKFQTEEGDLQMRSEIES